MAPLHMPVSDRWENNSGAIRGNRMWNASDSRELTEEEKGWWDKYLKARETSEVAVWNGLWMELVPIGVLELTGEP